MIPSLGQERRINLAYWVAAVAGAVAGIVPLLIGGTSSRLSSAVIPFGVAAVAMAASAVLHSQGRGVTSVLYFLAGLALVYGILAMFALPLQLAVLGTCPAPPAPCTSGLERPLTLAENSTMGVATGFAIVSLLVGFFGLVLVYRRSAPPPFTPPVRKIPPVGAAPVAPEKPAEKSAEPEAAAVPSKAVTKETGDGARPAEEEPELPAHEEEPELPAHAEEPELPAHEEEPELPPHTDDVETGEDRPPEKSTPPST